MQGLLRNHKEILLLLEVGAATEVHISTGFSTQLTQDFSLSYTAKAWKFETNTSKPVKHVQNNNLKIAGHFL